MNQIYSEPKRYPAPDLRGEQNNRKNEKWGIGRLVRFPVSYRYNGGVSIDGDWYPGVEVPPPIIPDGHELIGIGCSYDLNCCPPLATQYLRPVKKGD